MGSHAGVFVYSAPGGQFGLRWSEWVRLLHWEWGRLIVISEYVSGTAVVSCGHVAAVSACDQWMSREAGPTCCSTEAVEVSR